MEIALTSSTSTRTTAGSTFSNESAIASSNGLALLASLTLKKALRVDSDGQQQLLHYTTNHQYLQQHQQHAHRQQQLQLPSGFFAKVFTSDTSNTAATTASTPSIVPANVSSITATSKSSITSTIAAVATPSSVKSVPLIAAANATTTATIGVASTTPTSTVLTNKHNFQIPSDILDDLACRFIINVPDMELSNLIRICFQIELAHWFYLDFFCAGDEEKKLQPCGIKQFAMQLFQHIPFLRVHLSTIDKVLEDWKNYKLSVPTYGAILISEDLNYCLLVQSYFAKCSWGFPKGKVNENEDPEHCAAREVYEETGYDITELIVPNDYIEAVINYQSTRLYIVRNVSLNTQFSPRTRNEIKCCDWFPIDSLPINKNDAISKAKLGINANSFFMIMPFVKRLKKWVNEKRNGGDATLSRRKYSTNQSVGSGVGVGQTAATTTTTTTIASSPKSPVTTAVLGQTGGSSSQQKHINANSNCKKNVKQQRQQPHGSNEENNAATGTAATASNQSKRQRHKSMGDLDGIKLNNVSQNQANATPTTGITAASNGGGANTIITPTANAIANNNNNNSNPKRNSTNKIVAVSSIGIGSGGTVCNGTSSSSKRQLFHSQSQNVIAQQQQQLQGEKIVSSFDLIRKEKQLQIKAAKAQKQQQQQQQLQLQQQQNGTGNNNGRVRAKSQGDGISQQQQQQPTNKHNSNNNNNNGSNNKQRAQKQPQQQQTIIINNSTKLKAEACAAVTAAEVTVIASAPTHSLPAIPCADLLIIPGAAVAADDAAASAAKVISAPNTVQKPQQQQRPRPSSVSLHFAAPVSEHQRTASSVGIQRMASGTELRILKRVNSHQPPEQQHHHHQPLKFTPSFNSWTNFSFTKNFITNVFC